MPTTYLCLAVVNKLLVPEVGVDLHLHSHRLDAGIAQQSVNLLAAEVGDANRLDKTIVHKLFHLLPCVLHLQVFLWVRIDNSRSCCPQIWTQCKAGRLLVQLLSSGF